MTVTSKMKEAGNRARWSYETGDGGSFVGAIYLAMRDRDPVYADRPEALRKLKQETNVENTKMQAVGWMLWRGGEPYEPTKGRPFRVYANKGSALKMATDCGGSDRNITIREVFAGEGGHSC